MRSKVNKRQKTVAITGANGFVGSGLVAHFSKNGWRVVKLIRQKREIENKSISSRYYCIGEQLANTLLDDVDLLIHAAYVKDVSDTTSAFDLNLTSSQDLHDLARKSGVHTSVFISSLSAKETATSSYGQQKYAIEKLFSTNKDVVIRPGLVIGNGGLVADMSRFIKRYHAVPVISGGHQPLQVVDVPSIATAIETTYHQNLHGVFVVASSITYPYRHFYTQLARSIKAPVLLINIPSRLLLTMFTLKRRLGATGGVGVDNLHGLISMRYVDSKEDLAKLNLTIPSLEDMLLALKNA
ncbi:NAD-dependent epimerase/dehydratase family protein [bacterium]|nr:MAG: NAD-dependent epimerase/dehydratase family protein [bacterium]